MAKETFDRSKPHVNVGSSGAADDATIGFRDLAGTAETFTRLDNEDGSDDGLVGVNLGPNDALISFIDDAGYQVSLDTTDPSQWSFTSINVPLFVTDTDQPLLHQFDLAQFREGDLSFPTFAQGQVFSVSNGQISGAAGVIEIDSPATDLTELIDPTFSPVPYTGSARVAGFVEVNIPEPSTALLLLAATGVAILPRRSRCRHMPDAEQRSD